MILRIAFYLAGAPWMLCFEVEGLDSFPLRGSRASIVQNAVKVAFSDFQAQPSTEIARVNRAE